MSTAAAERPLTVLVYSDDVTVRNAVRTALGRRPAADLPLLAYEDFATEAALVRRISQGGVDLAILDGEAVPSGGMGISMRMRREIHNAPPVLLLTGRPQDAWLATWSQAEAVVPHPIDPLVLARSAAALLRREDLGPDDTAWAMGRVMDGDATPVQLAGFLVALRAKGETAGEVGGLVSAMLDHAALVDIDPSVGPTVDTCGTGGDRSHTVNISTMAAVVVAAAGAPVVKHGNRAASSAAGSADVLEALGVAVDLSPGLVGECLADAGIVFCFAPVFHPGMRHAAVARRELGVATVFNVLGPLANPARPAAQVVGCADARLAPVMAQALLERGTRALVVRGTDGLDELSTAAPTTVWDATGSAVVESQVDALDLGIARSAPGALRGQDAAYNAAVARAVLAGERSAALDPVRDSVLLGAAAAIVAHDSVGGAGGGSVGDRISGALPRAAAAIDDGSAGALLDRWVAVSQRLASR